MALNRRKIEEGLARLLSGKVRALDKFERVKGITPCEIVNEFEIYSLVECSADDLKAGRVIAVLAGTPYKRKQRICGRPRYVDERLLRCKKPAGSRTNHLGFGKCAHHERYGGGNSSLRILSGYKASGFALALKEFLELSPEDLLADPKLGKLDEEILVVEHLLRVCMSDDWITPGQILEIVKTLTALKVSKSKIEVDKLLLDQNSLSLFVESFFDVVKRVVGSEAYSRIATILETDILVPIKMQTVFPESKEVGRIEHNLDK